jgi:regulator of sigma E protease
MITLLVFLAVLAVLVLSHEWGHFIVARRNGMKVEEFGFGFPPRMVGLRRFARQKKWQVVWGSRRIRREIEEGKKDLPTLYSINWLPLGGFVKIRGEDSTDPNANDSDSFATKKPWRKASVLVAGVLMNIIVGAILLSVGFMIGLPQVAGEDGASLSDRQVQVIQVLKGLPAEQAGIVPGDIIVAVNDRTISGHKELQAYVHEHRNSTVDVRVRRIDKEFVVKIAPTIYEDTNKGGLGVAIAEVGLAKYPWYKAIYYGVITTGIFLKEIIVAFFLLVEGLITGAGVGGAVTGPVGVAVLTGQVARLGLVHLLQFTALLSLNLAVLNILPIPALDGGRLFFVIVGKIIGRPVSPRFEQTAHTIGFALLMVLVIAVTVKDLGALGGWMQSIFN